jgi:phosphoethanolamine N-methyltransferase
VPSMNSNVTSLLQFLQVLKRELEVTEKNRDKFIADFSEDDYNYIVSGWESKLKRCSADEQKWGLFVAHKAL